MAKPLDDAEVIHLPDWYETSCVIILGDTGLGKSTILNLCTRNQAPTGSTAEAVTRVNKIYDDMTNGEKYPKWMDTVGLNDTSKECGFLVFQKFLQELQNQNISSVHAIIWAITPSMREKKEFDEQVTQIEAIFKGINLNEKVEDTVDIWRNVILLCEKSFKDKQSFQGAKAAIKAKTTSESIDGIETIQMGDFRDDEGKIKLDGMEAIKTRDLIFQAVKKMSSPIRLNFKTMVCRDCGQIDDPRLMLLNCHWKPEKKWKVPPRTMGKYMSYLCNPNQMLCGNEQCLNDKHKRSKWSKKKWHGGWIYTEGDYKSCAIIRMIGKLEVTSSVPIDSANQMLFKDCHNLEEIYVKKSSNCYHC